MGIIIEGEIPPATKENLRMDLQNLFNDVFERGPISGQFYFKNEDSWAAYYNALCHQQILRGVWICRAINSGIVWFPVYHFLDQNNDESSVRIPDGAVGYAYVSSRG